MDSAKLVCTVHLILISTVMYRHRNKRLKYSVHEGCNTVAVACYAAAGFQFGTVVAAAGAPATILGCNAALGT